MEENKTGNTSHDSIEKQKVEVNQDYYQKLLSTIYNNKTEERNIALDRYRRTDEEMTTNEHFILMGKNAILFLKQASDCTNSLADLAKEIKSIVYKENDKPNVSINFDDSYKRQIIDTIKDDEELERKNEDLGEDDDDDNLEPV